ncbi:MAG: glutamate synthase subunit alpha, partial [Cyanobacteria bacterium J06649_4]
MTLNQNTFLPTTFQTEVLEPLGPSWLVEERDACGVGFIADQQGRASHQLVADTLTALTCMEHRGGCCADKESGDGAGIMTAIPWALLQEWASESGLGELIPAKTGVAMVFLPQVAAAATAARKEFEAAVAATGLTFVGWREVPVAPETLGPLAREFQPKIAQAIITSDTQTGDGLERSLFLARRRFEKAIAAIEGDTPDTKAVDGAYVCSLSARTIVYKGMVK